MKKSESLHQLLLQQMIRQKMLTVKQRKHRHTYYHDDHQHRNNNHHRIKSSSSSSSSSSINQRQRSARLIDYQSISTNNSMVSSAPKIIYELEWMKSDNDLPECEINQVCNKIDTYSTPWIQKSCRCHSQQQQQQQQPCSLSLNPNDGHTISEKNKQYKLCEPIVKKKLPTCRYFRDITWTITTISMARSSLSSSLAPEQQKSAPTTTTTTTTTTHQNENITKQEIKCICPPNSEAYILKHHVYKTAEGQLGYRYYFACSPETKLRCKRKEPCRLFTVRKGIYSKSIESVTTNTLCQCENGYECPNNHRQSLSSSSSSIIMMGQTYPMDNIRTYSGYCYPTTTTTTKQINQSSPLMITIMIHSMSTYHMIDD
nr:protein giant-lens-like isoform X2 [Dermatophagoides farinae]